MVSIKEVVWCEMLRETKFNDAFFYFWCKREVENWSVIREFILVQGRFLEKSVVEITSAKWKINYVGDSRVQQGSTN